MVDDAPLSVDAAVEHSGKSLQLRVRQADWKSAHIEGDLIADARLTARSGLGHFVRRELEARRDGVRDLTCSPRAPALLERLLLRG